MNNNYLKNWIKEAELVPDRVSELFQDISIEEINRKPKAYKWSIGELFDHLTVTNALYFPVFQKIIAGTHRNPFASKFSYLSDFFGKSILKSVHPENEKKLKTMRKFEPVMKEFTPDKINAFIQQHKELIALVKQTDVVNHTKTFIGSPANPVIVYSLEYANKIILAHDLRHIQQASKLTGRYIENV
ncbi:MAG: DinB family protein [Cyclobacteriaceae bacterium]